MNRVEQWKRFWNDKSAENISDFEYDRGRSPREKELEALSTMELLSFIAPDQDDVILDAGCGTGVNVLRLHSRVKHIIAVDYTKGAVERCKKRVSPLGIQNVEISEGDISNLPLRDRSVDKILCLSVLQYLDDAQVRNTLIEFGRILKDGGIVVLHVKNLSSLYLSTLWAAKQVKSLIRKSTKIEYCRSFKWYVRELASAGLDIIDYNSFNLLMVESMPRHLLLLLQKFELRNFNSRFFRASWIRRHGSDLKIKARIRHSSKASVQ